ncbi:MAG: hypothetical protein Q8L47_03420 [bacterium]|nr:hypothetical protein [bacterium]
MAINLSRGRALVVVAHPDDETIWMGGAMLAHCGIEWTIFALCRARDKERKQRFLKALKVFNAKGYISDLEDDDDSLSIKTLGQKAESLLLNKLPRKSYDFIFTHAKDGEYGNKRHKGVHYAVKNHLQTNLLQTKNFYCFVYEMHKSDKYALPKKNADYSFKLTPDIYKKKIKIIRDIYGFTSDSFEYKSCGDIEKFNIIV